MAESVRTWQIKDARANFSALVDKAISDGPQIVTRNGKKAVVVISAEIASRKPLPDASSVVRTYPLPRPRNTAWC